MYPAPLLMYFHTRGTSSRCTTMVPHSRHPLTRTCNVFCFAFENSLPFFVIPPSARYRLSFFSYSKTVGMQNMFCIIAILILRFYAVSSYERTSKVGTNIIYPKCYLFFNKRVFVAITVITFVPSSIYVIRQIKSGIVFPGLNYFLTFD